MSYEIKLPQFEGPFDLLLFFIERDELDIYDIPISKITDEFLEYTHTLQELNIEQAGEFILVAATLMKIKARMLLPRTEVGADGEVLDPRMDLVERLIEYKKFRDASAELAKLEADAHLRFKRGNLEKEWKSLRDERKLAEEMSSVDLFKLLMAFRKVVNKHFEEQNKPKHTIVTYPYSIEEKKFQIREIISLNGKTDFVSLVLTCAERIEAIFLFLAILDLIQQQQITLVIGEGFNNFWLEDRKEEES